MSSENTNTNSRPNNYINPQPNTEVRLAYYLYTWDSESKMAKQKTAWSSIGSYYLNPETNQVGYTDNSNQLIKTAGSTGVSVVDNTLGVIANVYNSGGSSSYNDVAPIILRADGKYIAGIDNTTVRNNFALHTLLNTIDLHFIETHADLNNHSITYSNLWGITTLDSTFSNLAGLENLGDKKWLSVTTSGKGDIVENTHVVLVGESGGLNKVENKGFVYNNLTYNRRYDTNILWRNFYNYIGSWTYGSNGFDVTSSGSSMQFSVIGNVNSTISQVNDGDIIELGQYQQKFEIILSNLSTYKQNAVYSNKYALISSTIDSMVEQINISLGNEAYAVVNGENLKYPRVYQTPITYNVWQSASSILAIYNSVSNVGDVYESEVSAIMVDRIPWNDTFIDINTTNTATAFAVVNDRTKTWQKIDFPSIDQTWQRVINSMSYYNGSQTLVGQGTSNNYSLFVNQYPITADASTYSNNSTINYILPTGSSSTEVSILNLGTSSNPSSFSYYLMENNLINSAGNFRFIGMETNNPDYSNLQGSSTINITGFNKILLSDFYENPNNYQCPTVTYYWNSQGNDISSGSSHNIIDIPVNTGISYTVNIHSALNETGNFLVAGVGQSEDDGVPNVGYNGVFYIPLPTAINQNEDAAYQDTHWMLTTYTPQPNNNAVGTNLPNSGRVLYKYTKMTDLITTGVFGGFTPYYQNNNRSNITAGLVNIPQVSYNSEAYISPNNIQYVSAEENQAAKISNLISDIAYITPATTYNIDSNDSWFVSFNAQITSNSDKCTIITLNSYEAAIIDRENWMSNNTDEKHGWIGNVMYLNLFGYDDGEWNNLSFNVNRKYIFTFNCHIQATNLNLVSDQINYGTPSLLLVGHFRQRYCKSALSNGSYGAQVYAGETKLIPLLNKPLENPVNNIYNIEGTYTLSWNTTGTQNEKAMVNNYTFYIPDEYSKPFAAGSSTFSNIYNTVFEMDYNGDSNSDNIKPVGAGGNEIGIITPLNNSGTTDMITYSNGSYLVGNNIEFLNVLDRIYAFILVGNNVNPNVRYQFVNNTTYQSENARILSNDDLGLFAGVSVNGSSLDLDAYNINQHLGIDGGILGVNEPMFSMVIQRY